MEFDDDNINDGVSPDDNSHESEFSEHKESKNTEIVEIDDIDRFRSVFSAGMAYEVSWTQIGDIDVVKMSGLLERLLEPDLRILAYLLAGRAVTEGSVDYIKKSTLTSLYYRAIHLKEKADKAAQSNDIDAYEKAKRKSNDYIRLRMELLCKAGLVERLKEGRCVMYRALPALINHFKSHVVNGPFGDLVK